MKLIGFEFQKPIEAYIGSVAIVAILYYPIVESTALKTTLGKKLLNV